jgi:hypothetical protein
VRRAFKLFLLKTKEKDMAKKAIMIMAFAQWTISGGLALSTITDITVKSSGYEDSPNIDPGVGIGGNIYAAICFR